MEDQQNGCIYETASPMELGVADHRDQALIVRRRGDGPETAQRRPIRRRQFPQKP